MRTGSGNNKDENLDFKSITLERLEKDALGLKINDNDGYLRSYIALAKFFSGHKAIGADEFIQGSHMVYAWMPTILKKLETENLSPVLAALNSAKSGHILDISDLSLLKASINNSIVGASKLLHFANPALYPIWDSRVYKYITGGTSVYGLDKPERYLGYLHRLVEITESSDYKNIHDIVSIQLPYEVTKMRTIELIMFLVSGPADDK